jgi:hypothetical protein
VSTPIAVDGGWSVAAAENPVGRDSRISAQEQRRTGSHPPHTIPGLLDDAVMLLLVILLVPLAILLVGMPVALLVRLLIEIAERM